MLEFKIAIIFIKKSSERANACNLTHSGPLNDNSLVL